MPKQWREEMNRQLGEGRLTADYIAGRLAGLREAADAIEAVTTIPGNEPRSNDMMLGIAKGAKYTAERNRAAILALASGKETPETGGMRVIILPDDDCGDWRAEARLQVEADGTMSTVLVREWRSDGVEPDDLSEQAESPEHYRH